MEKLRAACWLGLSVVFILLAWPLIDPVLEFLGDLLMIGLAIIGLIVSTLIGLPRSILLLAIAGVLIAILWWTRDSGKQP